MKTISGAAHPAHHVQFSQGIHEFLKMLGVAALGGLFFSLVAGLVVFLVATDTFAHTSPPQKGQAATYSIEYQAR